MQKATPREALERIDTQSTSGSVVPLRHGIRSDVGRKRKENQDSYGFASTHQARLFLVADGMGGMRGGALASAIAVNVIPRESIGENGEITEDSLSTAIRKANAVIFQKGQTDENVEGMGTTVVAIAFLPEKAIIAHVGDSRLYRLRDGEIEQLTNDHTLVQELIQTGAISDKDAENHPISHMLTRSLGPSPEVEVEVSTITDAAPGDRYLLCSDGLYNMVEDPKIAELLGIADTDAAAEELVEAALEGGGTDNITVEVIELLDGPPAKQPLSDGEELSVVTSSEIGEIDVDSLYEEALLAAEELSKRQESQSETNGSAAGDVSSATDSIIFGTMPTFDEQKAHERRVADALGLDEEEDAPNTDDSADVDDVDVDVGAGDDKSVSAAQLRGIRMLFTGFAVVAIGTVIVVLWAIFGSSSDETSVSNEVARTAVNQPKVNALLEGEAEEAALEEELSTWEPDAEAPAQPTPDAWPEVSVLPEADQASGTENASEADSEKQAAAAEDAATEDSTSEGAAAIEEPKVKYFTDEELARAEAVEAKIASMLDLSTPPLPVVQVQNESGAAEAIDWDVEAALRKKASEERAFVKAMNSKASGGSGLLLTKAEQQQIAERKLSIRGEIGEIDSKIRTLGASTTEDVKAATARIREELAVINDAVAQTSQKLEDAKLQFEGWKKLSKAVSRNDPFYVVDQVSQGSKRVRLAQLRYLDANREYQKTAEEWKRSGASSDAAGAAKVAALGRAAAKKRQEVGDAVYIALEEGAAESKIELAKQSLIRSKLEGGRDRLNRDLGFYLGFTGPLKDRPALYNDYLQKRQTLAEELESLRAKLSDDAELKLRLEAELEQYK